MSTDSAARARPLGEQLVLSLTNHVWHANMTNMLQTLTIPVAFWLRPICVCVAICWLAYRASQVLHRPLDELAWILGFDIPSVPSLDLAKIKADGVIIHWTLEEKQKHKSTLKYDIYLNGSVVDTVSAHESAVTISGLQPNSYYVVRVALVNNLDFSSRSAPVRFRTKPSTSNDFFASPVDGQYTDSEMARASLPRVRRYSGLKDVAPVSGDAAVANRENSAALCTKRNSVSRRSSGLAFDIKTQHDHNSADEGVEGMQTIQQLTDTLDAIRREADEIERSAKEEEDEEVRLKEDLTKERDALRAEVTEKEKASRNLKREVNTLERQNTAAQNERTKQERLLQQKKNDQQKFRDDLVRWAREIEDMRKDVDKFHEEKIESIQQAELDKSSLRNRQADEAAAMRTLDEQIRANIVEMKKIERLTKNSSPNGTEPEPSLVQQMQQDAEDDRKWGIHRMHLQQQYTLASQKLEAAKIFHSEQARYLESLRADRRRQDEFSQYSSPPATQERLPRTEDTQHRRRAPSGHSAESPHLANFSLNGSGPFGNTMTSMAPFGPAPFLNIHNGMTIAGPLADMALSDEDKERLTGGAPMSPSAAAELLPADLFSGDGDRERSIDRIQPLPGLGALPGLPGLPGAMAQHSTPDHTGPGPASPTSASSRSPSLFASPRGSSHNLQLGSPEHSAMDSDRRSIRSTRSARALASATAQGHMTASRFSSMFGIKPRHKPTSRGEEGPAFGSAQSHSMPKQDPGLIGITALHRKRNSSVSGPTSDVATVIDGASDHVADTPAPSRLSAFGALFGRERADGWPSTFTSFGRRPTSPRPVSTHSIELPRPSADSNRWGVDGWPGEPNAGSRSSPLSFGPGFALSQQPRVYGSRHNSRRPSIQYGSAYPPADILEDDYLDSPHEPLPPIGTRPADHKVADLQLEDNPKLNPAAKDFKSLFASMRGKDRDRSRIAHSDRSGDIVAGPSVSRDYEYDESPPNSRKSRDTRDTRSFTTTESSVAESGRNSHELARTPSYSNSDAPVPSPLIGSMGSTGKESFMQKITRKSSSGKFSLPTFKREKNRLDPSSAAASPVIPPPTAEEDDEESLSASLGSLSQRDTRESIRQSSGRGWSNVLKIGSKRRGNETPSLSSMASVDGDDMDDGA